MLGYHRMRTLPDSLSIPLLRYISLPPCARTAIIARHMGALAEQTSLKGRHFSRTFVYVLPRDAIYFATSYPFCTAWISKRGESTEMTKMRLTARQLAVLNITKILIGSLGCRTPWRHSLRIVDWYLINRQWRLSWGASIAITPGTNANKTTHMASQATKRVSEASNMSLHVHNRTPCGQHQWVTFFPLPVKLRRIALLYTFYNFIASYRHRVSRNDLADAGRLFNVCEVNQR